MTALKTASNLSFAKSAVAAAAGGQAHAGDPELAHGLQPKNSISLEDAARLIRETAEKLWRGSTASVQSLIDMLLNFFRWITRPFRVGLSGNAPADGTTFRFEWSEVSSSRSQQRDVAGPRIAYRACGRIRQWS